MRKCENCMIEFALMRKQRIVVSRKNSKPQNPKCFHCGKDLIVQFSILFDILYISNYSIDILKK